MKPPNDIGTTVGNRTARDHRSSKGPGRVRPAHSRTFRPVLTIGLVIIALTSVCGAAMAAAPSTSAAVATTSASALVASAESSHGQFNRPGDLLITDQFNNRVIEVDPLTKQIVWSFGSGNPNLCDPGPHAVIGPNDAERLSGGLTLIAGTGIPAGVPGTTPCVDNRVIVVNQAGGIVWQYGQAGRAGNGTDLLNVPVFAIQLPNHNFLIVDQGNNRVIEADQAKQIVWSYGPTSGRGALDSPNSAELLPNGDVLIADESNNRVIQINPAGKIVWQYKQGLNTVGFASRLGDGDTLISDSGHNRIVLVNSSRQVVFQYFTNLAPGSNATPTPTNAVKIAGGDIVISDQFNDRVIVINMHGQIVFQYGELNHPGAGFNELFGPYTAYEIGDYTGQTAPPASFS
jgi:hypothetical protein